MISPAKSLPMTAHPRSNVYPAISYKYEEYLNAAGPMGVWQLKAFFFICLSQFFQSMTNLMIVFMNFEPDFTCMDGGGFNSTNDRCSYTVSSINGSVSEKIACKKWVYDRSVMKESIVTQWNLVCTDYLHSANAQSVFMIGFFFGALLSGVFSDRFGRKKVVVISGTLSAILGVAQAYCPSFALFLVVRFLHSVGNAACYSTGFVLCMELTSTTHRDWVGGLFYVPYAIGYICLSFFAFWLKDWRQIQTAISLPVLINLLYIWLLPESPRWLFLNGKMTAFQATMADMAISNGNTEKFKKMTEIFKNDEKEDENEAQKKPLRMPIMPIGAIFKYRNLAFCCFLISFIWFITSMVYYGVSLNVSAFPGSLFVQNSIAGAVELPAYVLSVPLLRWGRRPSICLTLVVAGISLLTITAIPENASEWSAFRHILAITGKLAITSTFAILYVQTAEVFPTVIRDTSLGKVGKSILVPMFVYGSCSLIAAVVSLLVKETKEKAMPETLEDMQRSDSTLNMTWEERQDSDANQLDDQ